jgi:hypothetical protein
MMFSDSIEKVNLTLRVANRKDLSNQNFTFLNYFVVISSYIMISIDGLTVRTVLFKIFTEHF